MSRADDTDLLATLPTSTAGCVPGHARRLPGARVAIGQGGRVVFSPAYGRADAERLIPMRTDADPVDALAG